MVGRRRLVLANPSAGLWACQSRHELIAECEGEVTMISTEHLLFIEPRGEASATPLVDYLTRRMTAAFRAAEPSFYVFFGFHRCVCGARSSNRDYFLPSGEKTNSLCVHYLAYHRQEVSNEQLERVAGLCYGELDPSEHELEGTRSSSSHVGKAGLDWLI